MRRMAIGIELESLIARMMVLVYVCSMCSDVLGGYVLYVDAYYMYFYIKVTCKINWL